MNPHPNWPTSQTEIVFRDILDHIGNIVVPQACFKRTESWEYIGAGGIPDAQDIQLIQVGVHNGLAAYLTKNPEGEVVTVIESRRIVINGRFRLAQKSGETGPESWFWFINPESPTSDTQEMTKAWNVPAGWRLIYLLRGHNEPLVCLFSDSFPRRVAIPCLTNIFEDGKICMGYEWTDRRTEIRDLGHGLPLAAKFQEIMDVAPWNSDLIDGNGRKRMMQDYFRWSAVDDSFIPAIIEPPTIQYMNSFVQKVIDKL